MSTPGTPNRRHTRTSHVDCYKSPHATKSKTKPKKGPKPNITPKKGPGQAPFDVKSIVLKLNKKNKSEVKNTSDEESSKISDSEAKTEPDSATIEVSDDLKSTNPMEVDENDSNSDEFTKTHNPSLPKLEIPQAVRDAVGPNWRLKESVLNSYTFGAPSVRPIDFARSKLDDKTAEIIRNPNFSEEAKKYSVKRFLGKQKTINFNNFFTFLTLASYSSWLRNVVHYTKTIGGKRKLESFNYDSSSGPKYSKDRQGNPFVQSAVTNEYETYLTQQTNLENMRSVSIFSF